MKLLQLFQQVISLFDEMTPDRSEVLMGHLLSLILTQKLNNIVFLSGHRHARAIPRALRCPYDPSSANHLNPSGWSAVVTVGEGGLNMWVVSAGMGMRETMTAEKSSRS